MKKALPFVLTLLAGIVFFTVSKTNNSCLFYHQNKCYNHDEKDIFFVGLPENCQVFKNKNSQYLEWGDLSIWACLPDNMGEEDIAPPVPQKNSFCPKGYPLMDIVGNCYSCQTKQAVQLGSFDYSVCLGKRYLTKFRNSSKSNLCPDLNQIKDPEICLACHGKWLDEKCVDFSLSEQNFCQKNSDCPTNHYCHPFIYSIYNKYGICRPVINQKWFCSQNEGFSFNDASIFCQRQNAHIPTLAEIESEKNEVLKTCLNNKIWVHFDEGMLYLDTLNSDIITQEKISTFSGGDNSYALCRQN